MASIILPKSINSNKIQQFKQYYELTKLNDKKLSTLNPQSLINTLATIYELDLSNNPIKKEIALIPYGNDLQVQIQEDGFLTLLQRSNLVIDFQREIITNKHIFNKENKKWELDPSKIFEEKQIIGYYGFISIKNINGKIINFYKGMTIKECLEWKQKYSKANNNSPWNTSFNAMALKTVIKAIIRDINKDPSIKLENQQLLDRAMQIDQSSVINEEEISYIDNPNNDNQKVKLKDLDNDNKTFNDEKQTLNLKNEKVKDNIESLLGIGNTQYTVPTNFNFEEQQNIIDNLELD
ncbi:recombinase RecT [Spiroplasma endosymbiont of Dasysyrphus albostriatus]|uniref:recombinase RecT n=1 Tax=Spiroplasma endosymbiont of Dasysyrphus albostriatus TaxID=3066299 RepID=UPI0030D0FAF6